MRIKLLLRVEGRFTRIPINYQYPLSAAIYNILAASSSDYSDFLHNRGYLGADGKLRKLFTFSRLNIRPRAGLESGNLVLQRRHTIELVVASPMLKDFIQHFVVGLFQNQRFEIANMKTRGMLHVESVEACAEPEFTPEMKFKALSPIVLTAAVEMGGELKKHYYRPHEPGLSKAVRQSLIRKYETTTGHPPADTSLKFEVDKDYVARRGGPEKVMTLVRLKEGRPDQTNVKGFLAPFIMSGSTELIKTAWEAGVGDKCTMGFGCIGKTGVQGERMKDVKL